MSRRIDSGSTPNGSVPSARTAPAVRRPACAGPRGSGRGSRAHRLPRRAGQHGSDREGLSALRVRGRQGEDRRIRTRRGGGEPRLLQPRRGPRGRLPRRRGAADVRGGLLVRIRRAGALRSGRGAELRDDGSRWTGVRLGRAGLLRRRHQHGDHRAGHLREGRDGLLRLRVGVHEPERSGGRARYLDEHRQGDVVNVELKVTPDKYLPHRYAGASGDFNPIHIDVDFAKQVGLPSNILHGLYTMAQVARANVNAAGGDPRSLKRLFVQFRGMGFPEQEITVTGKVKEERDGRVVVAAEAAQGGKRIIRNAEAELETG